MKEALHIHQQNYLVCLKDRELKKGHKPACIWFTGFSGSGKSTLADKVEQELCNKGVHTYILDGDNMRKGLNRDLTFSEEDRVENIRRIGEVAKLMCEAGLVVLAAFITPFRKDRALLRELIGEKFIEVFVDTPLEVCEQRDVKGLYQKARNGEISNFTGISSRFEVPEKPDIHIKTNNQSFEDSVKLILDQVLPRLAI
ncbi:MAG: cysC [Segetibacter sp.]|jgi:adenylylsulfate kinase|nr:cysC [Segetibacter sp.]